MSTRPNAGTSGVNSRPSSDIWGRLPFEGRDDLGYVHFEDFANFDQTTGLCGPGGGIVISAGSSVALQTDVVNGVLRLTTQAADNDTVTWVTGDNTAGFGKFAAGKRFAFEALFSPVGIVTHDITIGLAQEALATDTGLVADADTRADVDFVGFSLIVGAATTLAAVYNTAGGGGYTTVKAAAITIAAASWYRVGVVGDGTLVTWYVDGTPIGSTAVSHPVRIDATNFPDGEELAAYVQIKATAAAAVSLDLHWTKWGMES